VFVVIVRGRIEKDEPDKRKDLTCDVSNALLRRSLLYAHFSLSSPQEILDDPDESMM
jgi:hypothetical protein